MEEVSSTNDYLKQLLSNIKPLAEGTAIMAKHQTKGRGQRGNAWHTASGENLTFSFNLYPTNLEASKSFRLNMIVCLGIQNWMKQNGIPARIKWPNDIYVNDRKIGGVLIETQLAGLLVKSAIIGIGINVNQLSFQADIAQKATSIRLLSPENQVLNIQDFCVSLLESILEAYKQYEANDFNGLSAQYNEGLFRKGIPSFFSIDGKTTEAVIKDVDDHGLLRMYVDGGLRAFDLKEISFII